MQTRLFPLLGVLLALGACGRPAPPPEHSGELLVGTRNSPASYYIDHNGERAGFEHDLIEAFSASQSWHLSWIEKDRPDALWDVVNLTRVHLAAAGLPLKVVESRHLKAGPVLYETPVHVVYRQDDRRPRGVKDLAGRKLGLIIGSGPTPMLMRLQRRPQRLPALRRHFQEAQTLTGIDWRLLAAIGYQESQWDPGAVSPTGVRGVMMLTAETADRMGVDNRLDPRQSIIGGARYLALLKDALPPDIAEPDRTWIALAAYNQGQGHMEDARRIAKARGGDPDSWLDVKQALPLLSRGGYRHVTRYGYARGFEALTFAENIRNYYDILLRLEPAFDPVHNLGADNAPAGILEWFQAGVSASSPPI
jgi:membrane-bound lytic murein transglycosylase MltF